MLRVIGKAGCQSGCSLHDVHCLPRMLIAKQRSSNRGSPTGTGNLGFGRDPKSPIGTPWKWLTPEAKRYAEKSGFLEILAEDKCTKLTNLARIELKRA